MSKFIDISVIGDKKLQQKLKRLALGTQKKIVRNAINRAILPVREKAKALVPFDTGLLEQSIKRKTSSRKGKASARIRTGTRAELGIPWDAKFYYPASVEFGTKSQPAYSYMRAAITALRSQVIEKTGDYIDENIKKLL
jgi:HK97 gp10 family phage protein|tara:strand:- start:102 stop:518 length:417 start_codon:yes stop_codon:yes gene_type:complete